MEEKIEYQDLVYFGYAFGEDEQDSKALEAEFIEGIKTKFEDVKLSDAYCEIKGYRQEVYLKESDSDNYFSWLIGNGWLNASLTMQLCMMDTNRADELKRFVALAKEQYPEAFKPEK